MTLPAHTPFDENPDDSAGSTFTYRWGGGSAASGPLAKLRGDGTGPFIFPKLSGTVMALLGLGAMYVGFTSIRSMDTLGWLPVGIGIILLVTGVVAALQGGSDGGTAPVERLIRVHYEPRAIEFCYCPFSTGLVRRATIESYLCPIEELAAFAYDTSPRSVLASVRIWTARGYLSISGDPVRLRQLMAALTLVAGKRPAPVFQRTWVVMLVVFLVAALVIAAAVYIKIV